MKPVYMQAECPITMDVAGNMRPNFGIWMLPIFFYSRNCIYEIIEGKNSEEDC